MALPEAKELARAVRDHALYTHKALTPRMQKGIIRRLPPDLTIEFTKDNIVLDEERILMGAWPRLYDRVYELEEGDTVFLYPLDDGDWLVVDVAGESDLEAEDWHNVGTPDEPLFNNKFVNYTAGGGYAPLGFKAFLVDDRVAFRGEVAADATLPSQVLTTIFTLPEGYRPEHTARLTTSALSGTPAQSVLATVFVQKNGDVQVWNSPSFAGGHLSFDGLFFFSEAA